MPIDDVSSARSCSGSKEEKTTTWRRARVIATFSRRSPPTRFSGPKFSGSRPRSFGGEAGGEEDDVALVALHVLQVLDEQALAVGAVQRRGQPVVVRVAQQRLDVGPLLGVEGDDADRRDDVRRRRFGTRSNRRRISATIAFASIGLVRSSRPAPERWNVPCTRTSETPRPSGSADGRPCVGAGNDDSRFS